MDLGQSEKLAEICRSHDVRRLELFGSALRPDFDPALSDYDFFVEFSDRSFVGAFKRYMNLKFDLEALLGRPVDLVEPSAVKNRYFIEATAERRLIYAA